VRVFKNTWFTRFADKEGITDDELRKMVNILEAGQADADLGGGVYKVRIARSGEGKSGGYRVIVFFKSGKRTFYVYGFAKSVQDNINEKQLRDFKRTAKVVLAMTEKQLDDVLKTRKYLEI
jgi:hypothetical protein